MAREGLMKGDTDYTLDCSRSCLETLDESQMVEGLRLINAELVRRALKAHETEGTAYGSVVDQTSVEEWLWRHRYRIPAMHEVAENLMLTWTERAMAALAVLKHQREIVDPNKKAPVNDQGL